MIVTKMYMMDAQIYQIIRNFENYGTAGILHG